MTGTAEQKVRHISDILGTLHFQGLDLDAESMKTLTQAAVRLQIPFEAAVAAMAQLRQAGFDAGGAAQSTTMLLNNLVPAARSSVSPLRATLPAISTWREPSPK